MSSAPSRSSANPLLDDALRAVLDRVIGAIGGTRTPHPVVLVDGRSGAGKTTFARMLVEEWPLSGAVQSVALDSLYPGWDGLDAGVEAARESILAPHARGEVGVWRRWDWDLRAPAEEHRIDPSRPLLVEGAGLLTPATENLGDVTVWLDAPAPARRERALDRDGETFRPHWEQWAAQEERHIARDDPQGRATIAASLP